MEKFIKNLKNRPEPSTLPTTDEQLKDFRELSTLMIKEGAQSGKLSKMLENILYENCLRTNIVLPVRDHAERLMCFEAEPSDYSVVFVWDLDDITMLSEWRLQQTSTWRKDIDAMSLHKLIEKILTKLDLVDPIATRSVVNIEDAFKCDFSYAPRYDELKNIYNNLSKVEHAIPMINHELLETFDMLADEMQLWQTTAKMQDFYWQRWKSIKKSLDLVNQRSEASTIHNYANVVISEQGTAQAAVQLLISAHSSACPIENIYSTFDMPKNIAWRRIQKRFGENCRLIYITSRLHACPHKMNIGICPVKSQGPLDYIYNVQQSSLE